MKDLRIGMTLLGQELRHYDYVIFFLNMRPINLKLGKSIKTLQTNHIKHKLKTFINLWTPHGVSKQTILLISAELLGSVALSYRFLIYITVKRTVDSIGSPIREILKLKIYLKKVNFCRFWPIFSLFFHSFLLYDDNQGIKVNDMKILVQDSCCSIMLLYQ